MRKLFVIFMLFLLPIFLFAKEGDFYNGYKELLADKTLSMNTDIVRLNAWEDVTAEWSTSRDTFGDYSIKIITTIEGWDNSGQVMVFYNTALESLEADGAHDNMSFWIYNESGNNPYPVLYIDTLGGTTVNYQLHGNRVVDITKNAWVNSAGGYQHTWIPHFYDKDKACGLQDGTTQTLAEWNAEYDSANVVYVALQFGYEASGVLYVDDFTIDGVNYAIEPSLAYDLVVDTDFLEQFSDSLYFDFALLAEEVGTQDCEIDIRLQYSPDGSNWSAAEVLQSDLDVGTTTDNQWYFPNIGGCADALYSMKNVRIIIDNNGYYVDNTNKIIIKSFGIAFKKEM